jgi:lysophospholipase
MLAIQSPPVARESEDRVAAFENRFEHEIMPEYRTLGANGVLESQGYAPAENTPSRQIHYRVFRRTRYTPSLAERGAIVIAPDRGELELEYAELIHDLTSEGYSVYILDHRGNGYSERLLKDRSVLHVDHFLDYAADFRKFIDEVVKPETNRDLYLLCHSMGCAAAAPFLASNPRLFRATAMTAPMFELKLTWTERAGAWLERVGLLPASMSTQPALGNPANDLSLTFEKNLGTGSWMRFHKERELVLDVEQLATRIAHRRFPVALARPSYHWLAEAQQSLQDLASSELWRSPTLVLQAGRDAFVADAGQTRLCERLAETGCRLVRYDDAFHDLLQERDGIRRSVIGEIEGFFESHATETATASSKTSNAS